MGKGIAVGLFLKYFLEQYFKVVNPSFFAIGHEIAHNLYEFVTCVSFLFISNEPSKWFLLIIEFLNAESEFKTNQFSIC